MKRFFFSLCFVFGGLLAQAQSSLVGKAAPTFSLEDQFDHQVEVKFPAKQPTFLLFSDRSNESAKQADQWGTELVGEYGKDIRVIVVAVTGKGANLVKKKVKDGLKKSGSDPILLDWTGDVSNQYGYTEKSALVVYINQQGTVEALEKGPYSEAKYNKLTEKLDEALDSDQ